MKHARDIELEQTATAIVKESKGRDEKGNLRYAFMQDPLLITMFQAPEALLEILKERPLQLLHLIQTNKALRDFWDRFDGIWILLVDVLIEKEMGAYAADVYPFFVMEDHLASLTANQVVTPNANFVGRRTYYGYAFRKACLPYNERDGLVFYVIPYDVFAKLYAKLEETTKLFLGREYSLAGNISIMDYLSLGNFASEVCATRLLNAFLVTAKKEVALATPRYYLSSLISHLDNIEWVLEFKRERGIILPSLTDEAVGLLPKFRQLVQAPTIGSEKPTPVKLDRNTTKADRDRLYDKEKGLYKTQEQQKAFFISVLAAFAKDKTTEQILRDYGELMPLACAVCRNKTHLVERATKTALCSEACLLITRQ